jgi:hypothetical protein
MPRVTKVQKARRSPGNCSSCGVKIEIGQPYFWWQFAFAPKSIRCALHPPAPKDLTRSAFHSTLLGIQEEDFTGPSDSSELESLRDDVVSQLEDLKSEIEGNLSNMPDSLQQGSTGELLQERIDALDEVISNLQGVDCSVAAEDEQPADEEGEEDREAQITERLTEIADELTSILGDVSCS